MTAADVAAVDVAAADVAGADVVAEGFLDKRTSRDCLFISG